MSGHDACVQCFYLLSCITLFPNLTVNSEIFARILFSPKGLKDIFATVKICDFGMVYIHQ